VQRGDCNERIALTAIGINAVLMLTSEEAASLTPMDRQLLIELGATEAMFAELARLGTEPGLSLRCDFSTGTVAIVDPDSP
jgi:hypothetical protein